VEQGRQAAESRSGTSGAEASSFMLICMQA